MNSISLFLVIVMIAAGTVTGQAQTWNLPDDLSIHITSIDTPQPLADSSSDNTNGRNTLNKNSIHVNILGGATLFSISYERLFRIFETPENKFGVFIAAKGGVGVAGYGIGPIEDNEHYTIPFHLTGNIGRGNIYFEAGASSDIVEGSANHYCSVFGIRVQPENLSVRFYGLYPSAERLSGRGAYIGVSAGYAF